MFSLQRAWANHQGPVSQAKDFDLLQWTMKSLKQEKGIIRLAFQKLLWV